MKRLTKLKRDSEQVRKLKFRDGGSVFKTLQKYQRGGDVALEYDIDDIPGAGRKMIYYNDPKVDSVLQANQHLNFVKRYLHPREYPVLAQNADGTERTAMRYDPRQGYSTHSMASGDGLVFPTVVQMRDGSMRRLNVNDAFDYAIKNKEYIRFPTDAEARKFAENGYKTGMQYWEKGGVVWPDEGGEMWSNSTTKWGLENRAKGGISTEGYLRDSPDRFNDFNVIPSNRITMRGVDHAVLGVDDMGFREVMLPGMDYVFPGRAVLEVPVGPTSAPWDDNGRQWGGMIGPPPVAWDDNGVNNYYTNKSNVMMDPYFSSPFYGYQPVGILPMDRPLPRRYQQGGTLNSALAGATRVNTAPSKYSRKVVQNGRTYYIDEGAGAGTNLPRATASGPGGGGTAFENQMRAHLQSGVPLSELIAKGYLSERDAIPYQKYDRSRINAVYTDAPPPAPVPRPAPVYDPTMGFNGEPIYKDNRLDAMIKYPSGPAGSANQPAQVMFVDRNGQYDPTRGYYETSPEKLRKMLGTSRHWGDTTGLYRDRIPVPRDAAPADIVAGRRFQDGGSMLEEAIRNARYVSEAPSTYSQRVQRNNRDYYVTENATKGKLRRASGSGDGGSGYTKLMQQWAAKGVDPNEMARQGYIHKSRVPEFMAYYNPNMSAVYTAGASPVPVPVTTTSTATGTAQVDPTVGFDGEPIYDGNTLDAVIRYQYGPQGSADKTAEVMYVDRNGRYDPKRGFLRGVPARDLDDLTGGTRHWQKKRDMSQWRVPVPSDLPVEDIVAGKRFAAGGPYSGGPYYPYGTTPYYGLPGNFFF